MPQEAMPSEIAVREFRIGDYDQVMRLWEEGRLPLKPEGRDSRANIFRQLAEPVVIFLVAETRGEVVGTVLATHDGRKGGLGRRLVLEAEARLEALGLEIFACLIEDWNDDSMDFFEGLGYRKHPEILYFAKRKFPGA
jgi:GNAT superfamily N-acetyltransferase